MKKDKKTITFVVTQSEMGGAQKYVADQAENLKKIGYAVNVICGGNGLRKNRLAQNGIPVINLPHLKREIGLLCDIRHF